MSNGRIFGAGEQKNYRMGVLACAAGAAVLAMGLCASSSFAADITWTGAALDENDQPDSSWLNPGNWGNGTIPGALIGDTTENTDTATFGVVSTNVTVMPDAGLVIGRLNFGVYNGQAKAYQSSDYIIGSTTGEPIRFSSNSTSVLGMSDANATVTINSPIILYNKPAGGVSYQNSGNLIFNGTISSTPSSEPDDAGTYQFKMLNTSGITTINGSVVDGSATSKTQLYVNGGAGRLIINGTNTNSGGIGINATDNTIELKHAGAVTGANFWTQQGGGKLVVSADNAITDFFDENDNLARSGSVTLGSSASAGGVSSITFNNPNNYSGSTSISAHTTEGSFSVMYANNDAGSATGTGNVTIGTNGRLAGDGRIDNSGTANGVTLSSSSSSLAPGAAAGQIGTLTLSTGSKGVDITKVAGAGTGALIFDLGSLLNSDQVVLETGTLLKFGVDTLEFDDFAFNPLAGFGVGEYMLFVGGQANAIAGGLGTNVSGLIGDFTGMLSIDDNHQAILLTVVPEPASLSVLALGAMGLLARRRRMA